MFTKSQRALLPVVLFLCLFSSITTLSHKQQNHSLEDIAYAKLNEQQTSLQDKINSLLSDMNNVEKSVSTSPNSSDKVVLLENAILSEREKVFNMQKQLIPPFSLSKRACLQMTNQQKIDMLDRIQETKTELTTLQQQVATAPKCDKIDGLQKDTQKQLALLQSLQKTIYTECQSKSILTPTIYQTNIYADGWILGDQNIDDLIEEYYQRNIRYHNITNCPLDKPFFNGAQCIMCFSPEPVFNILTKQCTHCPEDQSPDSTLRQCVWKVHYTNFSSVDNWAQEGAPMPVPPKQLEACPLQRPYFNGKKCEACWLPKYWSIQKNACVECTMGTGFDINTRKCEVYELNPLSILQGTRWVTNDCNLTRIIEQRVRVLNENINYQSYQHCPPQRPFYDGIVCVGCANEFNMDSKRCVSSSNPSMAYDQNQRCYVQKQSGFQTEPSADKYTTQTPLVDSPLQNCYYPTPFYDGIACINCLDPFPIFDVDTRRCTACDAMEYYSSFEHKCIPRQNMYFSTNEINLMATPTMSIDDYHAEIAQKVNYNPEALILLCQPNQYSDYNSCFNCSYNEYFNVQTKRCQLCDGTIDPYTKLCSEKAYIYTNLNQDSINRIVAVPSTIEQQNATINNNLLLHSNSRLCPVTQPYFAGGICTNCTGQAFDMTYQQCVPMQCTNPQFPFYNTATDKCQQCPQNTRYVQMNNQCQPIVYVTNTNAIYFYIEEGNATKKNLQDQIFNLQADHSVITCDASHPYWNGTDCMDCAITRNIQDVSVHKPYFNLLTRQCQACDNWDNQTHRCLDQKACMQPTPIFDPVTNSCKACPTPTVYNPTSQICEPCADGQIYNPKTLKCEYWVTDTKSLNNNYIEEGNGTKANLKAQIQNLKATQKVIVCPTNTPFFSKPQGKCINCVDPTPYFDILTSTCKACDNYNSDTHQCEQLIPRFKMNVEDFYGTIFT